MKILAAVRHPGPAEAVVPVIKKLRSQGHQVTLLGLNNNSIETKTLGGSVSIFNRNNIEHFDMVDMDANFDLTEVDSKWTNSVIEKYKPDRILVGCSTQEELITCIENAFILAGSNYSIPTLQLVEMWGCWTSRPSMFYPDRFAILDLFTKNVLLERGAPQERIKITGNPSFDDYYYSNLNQFSISPGESLGSRKFIYVGQVTSDNFTTLDWTIKSLGENDFLAFAKHPRDSRNYDELLKQAGDRLITTNLGSNDLLKRVDVCLTHTSTMGVKAALLGRPTINFIVDNNQDEVNQICGGFPLVLAEGSYKADSLETLRGLLKKDLIVNQSKLCSILNIDGMSAARVVDYLLG